jgi:adenylate cyclase
VLTRLVGMWLLGSGLPSLAIAGLVLSRSNGWIIQKTGSVEMPILVVTLVAILIGLPVMIMTSRSISDPVREVVDAMAKVERGRIDTFVGVYEKSEIGRLQHGFNRMVAGIGERDRLRDLFGRHVGADVARRAIEEGTLLSGDVREAAILFIDLVGSTTLTASRPPQEVAQVLNDFFRIVVSAVDDHHGLINKFQGDAALAVFGAPLALDRPRATRSTASATDGRLRDRRIGGAGVRRKHRRRKALRVHRCRRCGQRGGATGRLRQDAGPTDRVFSCRNRARRHSRAPKLGLRR